MHLLSNNTYSRIILYLFKLLHYEMKYSISYAHVHNLKEKKQHTEGSLYVYLLKMECNMHGAAE